MKPSTSTSRPHLLLTLFWEMFKISLFVIGGGFAIIAVADEVFARKLKWTKEGELLEHLPVFQMVPGLIAGNTAIYLGRKKAGVLGAAVALLGVILPSLVIFTAAAMGYNFIPKENPWLQSCFTGLRASLAGVIFAMIWRMWPKSVHANGVIGYLIVLAGVAGLFCHVNAAALLFLAGLVGWFKGRVAGVREQGADTAVRFNSFLVIPFLFLFYGCIAFGGGYVLVPVYIEDFVGPAARYLQLSMHEFSDIMALTQMTPGPISINAATFFGFRLADGLESPIWGIVGAGVATASLLFPSFVLLLLALRSLERFKSSRTLVNIMSGLKPMTAAMMISAFWAFSREAILEYNIISIALTILTVILMMKKKFQVMTIIALCALLATVARAEDELEIFDNCAEVTHVKYPDADSVVVQQTETTTYEADGTYSVVYETYAKVLTEKGRKEESELSLEYNDRYGTAEVMMISICGTNGLCRPVDFRKTLKESTNNSSLKENIVDPHDRQLSCTIPGLQVGEVLHLKWARRVTKSRIENQYSHMSVMEWTCPILKSKVVVNGPVERPLKQIRVRNPIGGEGLGNLDFSVQTNGARIVYTWASKTPAAQVFPEPNMPPLYTQVENIRGSTAANWEEISRWYWGVSYPHLLKTNAEITNKVEEVGHDVTKLYKWVAQNIRYMGLTLEEKSPGYAPHDVNITFADRAGVCRDKAGLLVAMLRIAGFEAYPVLIHNGAKQDPDVPMPYFNHAIVCVKKDGRIILMDPTDEASRDLLPSYLSDKSYLVATPEGDPLRTSPTATAEDNSCIIEGEASVTPEGSVLLNETIRFNGINDNAFRSTLVRKNTVEQRKLFERILQARYAGAELMECQVSPTDLRDTLMPLSVKLVARLPQMILRGNYRDEVIIPTVARNFGVVNWLLNDKLSLKKRRFPLDIDSTASVKEHLRLVLGESVSTPVYTPDAIEIKGPYEYRAEMKVEDGVLESDKYLAINTVEFSPAEYLTIRDIQKRIEASERVRPIFARNYTAGANVRYEDFSTETDFTGDRSWVTTNRTVKEILTYEGKKSSSELNYWYNPSWERTVVTEAFVSNVNGKVVHLSKKAVNEMDCDWASAAPRYPATKHLVVNLPSVEEGSWLYYTTVTTVTNAPVEFYGDWLFDVYDPTRRLYARCGDWWRQDLYPKQLYSESMTPPAQLWRDYAVISSNDFKVAAARLREATAVKPHVFAEAGVTIRSIRDWLAKHIRVVGPGVYDVPLRYQMTPPETILKERYACRLDYVRTFCALLKGAGYEADIVFASLDGTQEKELQDRDMFTAPRVRKFSAPLVRVTERTGGFLGFFCDEKTYFLGTENEYIPLGATDYDGSHYLDPETGDFGTVTGDAKLWAYTWNKTVMNVETNGTVALDKETVVGGTTVGSFRKVYTEMLPEDRDRHYLELISFYSSAAEKKGDLVTDVKGYPFKMTYGCTIPNYAVAADNAITVTIPAFYQKLFPLSGETRLYPIGVPAAGRATDVFDIVFPEGYIDVERLPQAYRMVNPMNANETWIENFTTTETKDGHLVVHVWRETYNHIDAMFDMGYFGLLKDWSRIGSSRANRTITVRRRN